MELLRAQERYRTQDLTTIWDSPTDPGLSGYPMGLEKRRNEPTFVSRSEGRLTDDVRSRVTAELEKQGHNTAAVLLESATWNFTENGLEVRVGIKKTMLGLTLNKEAMTIVQRTLLQLGLSDNILFIPSS